MYDNRELSWLKFNMRVLEEADRDEVPPLERLRFLSIATSNMDEFFMVRVGKIHDSLIIFGDKICDKTEIKRTELLKNIYESAKEFYKKKKAVYNRVKEALAENGIRISSVDALSDGRKSVLGKKFEENIRPMLSAQLAEVSGGFNPENKTVYCAVHLNSKGRDFLGIITKSRELENVILLKNRDFYEFVLTDDAILEYAELMFPGYKALEKCLVRVTRNADMAFLEQEFAYIKDYRLKMKKILRKRKRLAPVRIEVSNRISKNFKRMILNNCTSEMFSVNKNPLSFDFASEITKLIPGEIKEKLSYPPFSPSIPDWYTHDTDMFEKIKTKDLLLNYPYDSQKPFLRLLEQAAYDESVKSVKITLYRINTNSSVVQSLIKAAEHGKKVFAVMELRARFDEENNINYSELLEKNGVSVIYGPEKFKVHAKICSVERNENGTAEYYTHIGTGNYNENTACQYTDLNLLTNDRVIGKDASEFFHNLLSGNLYCKYNKLIFSPDGIEEKIAEKLDELMLRDNGRAVFKCNSLTSERIMNKIIQACEKGVKIDMIVRGICCLVPNTSELRSNLRIVSIVGRFLEHSRVYAFFKDEESEVYISSADLMTRNLKKRVEAAVPIKDDSLKKRITDSLEKMLCDDVRARRLNDKAEYERAENKNNFDSQLYFVGLL